MAGSVLVLNEEPALPDSKQAVKILAVRLANPNYISISTSTRFVSEVYSLIPPS